jgi:GNAT superfamily N-acetyltransferase
MQAIRILEADLAEQKHQEAVLRLVDMYSRDPMGSGQPLSPYARENLVGGLRAHPGAMAFLAYAESDPVGIAVCFTGFSTFAAKPLINIHDIAVEPGMRNMGIGKSLLAAVEKKAREMGCCKLTLEVLERNANAKGAYHAFGFGPATEGKDSDRNFFLSKKLD